MQQRFSSSTFGYPWINYKCVKISRNTHARRHTSNIVFIIPTMQLNQIKKKKKKQSSLLSAFSSARVDGPGSEVWGPGAGISPSTSNSVSFSKFSLQYNRRLS